MTTAHKAIHVIDEQIANKRLDQGVAILYPQFSRSQLKQWILQGNITLDHRIVKPNHKLLLGQSIQVQTIAQEKNTDIAINIPLNILFEDDTLLILNKPKGLVVHPGAGNQSHTLLNALLHHNATLNTLPRAGIIHRLDKDTTGLMVVAKTLETHSALVNAMQERTIQRHYQAIVQGVPISGGTIDANIARHPTKRTHMAVRENGKPAITHYRIIEKFAHHTHLDVQLETGRTHQIRVHMSHIHHPIVGDTTYGGRARHYRNMDTALQTTVQTFPRQALHAYKLSLLHPITQERMTFEAELPTDMQDLLNCLRCDKKET